MKRLSAIVLLVFLAVCAQEAHSWPWWKRIPPGAPSPPVDSVSAQAPNGSDSPPEPPIADEIAKCQAARRFSKWKPCVDEIVQEKRSGNFTMGPACCSYVVGVVDSCYSHFSPQFKDQIYPPRDRAVCSQYH